jgi:acyl-CoA synthetase (AMP-forming)/AMP-acid ligase II
MSSTLPPADEYEGVRLTGRWRPRIVGESMAEWAATRPDAVAHEFVDYLADRKGLRRSYTWAQWDVWTRAIAHRLQGALAEQGKDRSERVAILAPQGPEYVAAFHAALRAGVVAVPLFQPDLPGHGDRLEAVFDDCSPSVVVTTLDKRELVEKLLAGRGLTGQVALVFPEDVAGAAGSADAAAFTPPADLALDDVAYLQYTSGSTRAPRGVVLTQRNLVYNITQIIQSHAMDEMVPDATGVSWLPLFHDMGLLLGAAATAVTGAKGVVFDPLAFILKPSRWVTEIAKHPYVMSAAPNFAYAVAARKAKPEELEGLDYSQVISLVNGAEPVLVSTLEKFSDAFVPRGLPDTALRPSYGLAEATLFVAVGDPAAPRVVVAADVEALQRGVLTPGEGEARTTTIVSCGRPFGLKVAIVDPGTGRVLPAGHVGEIWVNGPNVGRGYWRKPEETAATFGGALTADDAAAHDLPAEGWLRTGDLGALRDRDLFITGRQKDLIIVDGRNIYPHDVEFSVEHAHDAIALHKLAAFSVPTPDGEGVVVVAEQYQAAADAAGRLAEIDGAARQAVSEQHSVGLHDFVLIAPGTIPWTSSGKIARQATRTAYLDGTLTRVQPS